MQRRPASSPLLVRLAIPYEPSWTAEPDCWDPFSAESSDSVFKDRPEAVERAVPELARPSSGGLRSLAQGSSRVKRPTVREPLARASRRSPRLRPASPNSGGAFAGGRNLLRGREQSRTFFALSAGRRRTGARRLAASPRAPCVRGRGGQAVCPRWLSTARRRHRERAPEGAPKRARRRSGPIRSTGQGAVNRGRAPALDFPHAPRQKSGRTGVRSPSLRPRWAAAAGASTISSGCSGPPNRAGTDTQRNHGAAS